jgi:hypothetical protein
MGYKFVGIPQRYTTSLFIDQQGLHHEKDFHRYARAISINIAFC